LPSRQLGISRVVNECSAVDWQRGSRSIYFADPEGHLLELATPGLWSVYQAGS